MTKYNISVSIGGTNLGDNPSTTMNVTQWVGNFNDFMVLCQKAWMMLTDEHTYTVSFEDKNEAVDALTILNREGFVDDNALCSVADTDC